MDTLCGQLTCSIERHVLALVRFKRLQPPTAKLYLLSSSTLQNEQKSCPALTLLADCPRHQPIGARYTEYSHSTMYRLWKMQNAQPNLYTLPKEEPPVLHSMTLNCIEH